MYSTLDNIQELQTIEVLLQLSDDNNEGQFVISPTPNAAYGIVVDAINAADVIINSYLSGRYTVPIPMPVPPLVVQISANFALCNLYERRRELDVPEGITVRRRRFTDLLKDIKTGTASIPELETSPVNIAPAPFLVTRSSADQVFSDDLLSML